MSRIGKKPIIIPDGVTVIIEGDKILVKGPNGEVEQKKHPLVDIVQKDKEIIVSVKHPEEKRERALWGLFAVLIKNMVQGVTQNFEKKLEINGIGYKASLMGDKIVLNIGFSHPVNFILPKGIFVKIEKNIIIIAGADKQSVGETAARIRAIRKPEPYKGKGIKYIDEVIHRKAGKTAKTGTSE